MKGYRRKVSYIPPNIPVEIAKQEKQRKEQIKIFEAWQAEQAAAQEQAITAEAPAEVKDATQ